MNLNKLYDLTEKEKIKVYDWHIEDCNGIYLNYDKINAIALNFDENVRMLEGAIRRLVTYCATFNSPITLEIAESALDSIIEKSKTDITPSNSTQAEKIKQVVANYYKLVTFCNNLGHYNI